MTPIADSPTAGQEAADLRAERDAAYDLLAAIGETLEAVDLPRDEHSARAVSLCGSLATRLVKDRARPLAERVDWAAWLREQVAR